MTKRIVVISTSLRDRSNTDVLAKEFARGAEDAGNDVECIRLIGKEIGFCKGCLACQRTGRCVIRDDAPTIMESVRNADVLAFATPVYYYGMSGQMKTLLDRMNPLFASEYSFSDVYLLTAGAETEESLPDGTVTGLSGWISCFGESELKGMVCAYGSTEPDDVLDDGDAMRAAYEMGRNA